MSGLYALGLVVWLGLIIALVNRYAPNDQARQVDPDTAKRWRKAQAIVDRLAYKSRR